MKKIIMTVAAIGLVAGVSVAVVVAKESALTKTKTTDEKTAETASTFDPAVFAGTAFEAISKDPDLSTFMTAINKSDLAEELKGKGLVTIFAPNNEAFAKLPEGFLDSIMKEEKSPILDSILSYHIVPGKILTTHLTQDETAVSSLKERAVSLKKTPEGITFNGGLITKPDMQVSNGALHIINSIDLNPQALAPVMPTQQPAAPLASGAAPDAPKSEKAQQPAPQESQPAETKPSE